MIPYYAFLECRFAPAPYENESLVYLDFPDGASVSAIVPYPQSTAPLGNLVYIEVLEENIRAARVKLPAHGVRSRYVWVPKEWLVDVSGELRYP